MSQGKPFNYGGQAVIEGVMMRGSKAFAVAVRNPYDDIVIHVQPLNQRLYGGRLLKIPFLRGILGLWDALGLGMRALMFSADVALEEEEDESSAPTRKVEVQLTADDGSIVTAERPAPAFSGAAQWGMVAFSLSLSIGLFFALPALVGGLAENAASGERAVTVGHLVEGLVRLTLLVGYIAAIGRMEDVKRLFGYHGAEHKTINAFEAGAPLTPQSVARFPLEHPRCGTAFLLSVVVISIILFTLLPPLPGMEAVLGRLGTRIVTRIVLVPVVAGIAYEYLRLTARFQHLAFVRWIIRPNLALQRLTTREPDETMIEVAIAAFERVLSAEQTGDLPAEQTIILPATAAAPAATAEMAD